MMGERTLKSSPNEPVLGGLPSGSQLVLGPSIGLMVV
jgi:hypothetical protein